MRGKLQPKIGARNDLPKLDKDVWQWLENWPPVIEPKPSNEPDATVEESHRTQVQGLSRLISMPGPSLSVNTFCDIAPSELLPDAYLLGAQ